MTIRKATITVTVLYDTETSDDFDGDTLTLTDVAWAIDEGDCIGTYAQTAVEDVPADKVQAELRAIGNDGTFFSDGDDWMSDETNAPDSLPG